MIKNIKRRRKFRGFSIFDVLLIGTIADGLAVIWILGLF